MSRKRTKEFVEPVLTIIRLVTQKDGGVFTYFDTIDESKAGIDDSSLKQILIKNHTADNSGIIRGHLPLKYIFGFCKSLKKITKGLGFELDLRTSNRKRDVLYTTLGDDDVNVTINNISLFIPQIIPSLETQVYFNEATSKMFTFSYESRTTDQKPVDTARKFQIDISSASDIKSPVHLTAAHQLTRRPDLTNPNVKLSNNRINNAIFDHAKVRKCYVEIDGVRYPKNPIMINYDENNYLDHYRDLKLFYKEYAGESMLSPIITYNKMKNWYYFRVIGLRLQVDHLSPKKIRFPEEYYDNPVTTNLYKILIKHRNFIDF